jgi:hypothetical protein
MTGFLFPFRTTTRLWLLFVLLGLTALLARPAQAQQQLRVSGTVSAGDTRQPIPGATVQVERTRSGVAANAKGDFNIVTLSTDTLQFRAIGYKTKRLPLGGSGLSQLIIQVVLVRDSVQLGEVRVTNDRPDRATINRALRNMRKPLPTNVSQVKRPPRPKPLFPVDSAAPKAPVATLENPISLIYDQFSREGKQRRKLEELQAKDREEKARKAREKYNQAYKDSRGYE